MDVAPQIQPRLESAIGQRYEVLGPIGRGGMATVYLARHRVHGGFCAIKVLADHLAKQPPLVKSFLTEARASASLDEHPNIVNIIDIDEHGGLYYMIMKYIEGEDLSTYLQRRKKLPWQQAAYIAAEVAEALAWSHDRGVIHRDMKPSNIRLNRRGGVTVMDFGIAKVGQTPSSFTEMGTRAGTPHYMAPEQIKGEFVDHRSDLYGLGIILYQMVAGSRPFAGDSAAVIWEAHLFEPPRPPQEIEPSIPDPLSHIILTLLAKDAEQRYDSAARLVRHLRSLGLEGVAATLNPVDTLGLDNLRTQEMQTRNLEPPPKPTPEITETGQTSGSEAPAAPGEGLPDRTTASAAPDLAQPTPPPTSESTPAPAAVVPTPTPVAPPAPPAPVAIPTPAAPPPPPAPPVETPLRETASIPTLPPPARKPTPRPPDTGPFQAPPAASSSRLPLIIGGSLAVLLAIAGVLFLRPGASSAPEPPPVIEAPPPAAVEGEATPPDEAAVPAPEAEAEAAPKPVAPAPAPKPAAPRTGAIYFRTDPAGARIQVDNRPDWTCETPCWLEALSPGQHTVTAKLEGFRVGLERIEVAAGAREPLAIELEADLISAMISSTPPGADIYIDGQKRPEKTNARIPLKPGTYQVRVVLPGGIEGEQVLAVSESQMPFASFTLEAK